MTIQAKNGLSGAERRELAIEHIQEIANEWGNLTSPKQDEAKVLALEHVLKIFRESQE